MCLEAFLNQIKLCQERAMIKLKHYQLIEVIGYPALSLSQ